MKALPDPDLRYFSKLKAVLSLLNAKYEIKLTGILFFVASI